jgi:hypothetical protein
VEGLMMTHTITAALASSARREDDHHELAEDGNYSHEDADDDGV